MAWAAISTQGNVNWRAQNLGESRDHSGLRLARRLIGERVRRQGLRKWCVGRSAGGGVRLDRQSVY